MYISSTCNQKEMTVLTLLKNVDWEIHSKERTIWSEKDPTKCQKNRLILGYWSMVARWLAGFFAGIELVNLLFLHDVIFYVMSFFPTWYLDTDFRSSDLHDFETVTG